MVGGTVRPGDEVVILPSAKRSAVARIVTYETGPEGTLPEAVAGQAVTLVLEDEVDVSRGDVIVAPEARPEVADQFAAHMVWMSEERLYPGRSYLIEIGTMRCGAQVTELKHVVNVNTLEHMAAKHLDLNDVAFCNFSLDRSVPFDPTLTTLKWAVLSLSIG